EDPFWNDTDLRANITRPQAPVLLVSGWWDLHLDQTLDLRARLEAAGRSPHLLVGPWTHTSMVDRAGWPVVLPAVLAFLREHLDGEDEPLPDATRAAGTAAGRASVTVHVGGAGWRELATWPPAAQREPWSLLPNGVLSRNTAA